MRGKWKSTAPSSPCSSMGSTRGWSGGPGCGLHTPLRARGSTDRSPSDLTSPMGRSTARELPLDHVCAWRDEAEELRKRLSEAEERQAHLEAQLAALQRHVFGKRSEKMPPVAKELRDRGGPGPDPAASKEKRKKRAEARRDLP